VRVHLPDHPQTFDDSAVKIDKFSFSQLAQINSHMGHEQTAE
jgi:hypothetical protein